MSHTLYRAYDAGGDLLYIGLTTQFQARMIGHRSSSEWFALHTLVTTMDVGDDYAAARAAESAAILMDQPRFNIRGKKPPRHMGAGMRGVVAIKNEVAA